MIFSDHVLKARRHGTGGAGGGLGVDERDLRGFDPDQ